MRKEIQEGCRLPPGYGVAWFKLHTREAVCYPIPLNLFCRWIRECFLGVVRGPRTQRIPLECLYEIQEKAYECGYKEAMKRITESREKFRMIST